MKKPISPPGAPPQSDFIPRIGAGCLLLLGLLTVVIAISISASGAAPRLLGSLFYGLLGIGFGAAGVYWYRYVVAVEKKQLLLFEEKALLNVAVRHGGYVTVAQLTLEAHFTAAEAEEAVARLCRQGFAHPELLDDGTVRYRFGGLLQD